jgi:L-malate glycosyltransferase
MRILLLSDPNSAHTIKWAKSLAQNGLEILIFGLSTCEGSIYQDCANLQVSTLGIDSSIVRNTQTTMAKTKYFQALPWVKRIIAEFKPHLVHAHYASSYGLIGALSGFHPYILSVWGADIFEFPRKSFLHQALIRYNLKKADKILSTSQIMAREINKYTRQEIEVTPFGIDLDIFGPQAGSSLFDPGDIVIGTIKGLEEQYGVEYLIRAFKLLRDKYQSLPLKLLIVGGGSLERRLKMLVKELNLENDTVFTGRVNFDTVPHYHNVLAVYVALSVIDSESFGVAVIEASACGKPVVVSDVGGLPEVVENGVTGFVVPARNAEKAAEAIERLIFDRDLRIKMGQAGRDRVKKLYNWADNVRQMINIYEHVLESSIRNVRNFRHSNP